MGLNFMEKQLISRSKQGKYKMNLKLMEPENRGVFEKEKNMTRRHRTNQKKLPKARTGIIGSTKLIGSNL